MESEEDWSAPLGEPAVKAWGNLKIVSCLTAIWGIFALSIGAYLVSEADVLVDMYVQLMEEMGYADIVTDDLASTIIIEGSFLIASGVAGFLSAALIYKAKDYKKTLIAMIACVALSWPMFFSLIIGVIMIYLLSKDKTLFTQRCGTCPDGMRINPLTSQTPDSSQGRGRDSPPQTGVPERVRRNPIFITISR